MLEPTIRNLGIKFDSKTAYSIMTGQKGAASKMLYQIKMAVESKGRTSQLVSGRAELPGGIKPLPNMPVSGIMVLIIVFWGMWFGVGLSFSSHFFSFLF